MAEALLLIDFQRDFLSPDGRMPIAEGQVADVIAATNELIDAAKRRGDLVAAISNEFHQFDPLNIFRRNAALAGSPGACWDERVRSTGASYFRKWRGDAFCNPLLQQFLKEKGIDALSIAGLMASACVTATAKSALRRGFRVTVVARAVADTSERRRQIALERLCHSGITIWKN